MKTRAKIKPALRQLALAFHCAHERFMRACRCNRKISATNHKSVITSLWQCSCHRGRPAWKL